MNKRMLSLALVCSVALNLGFVGMCAYNILIRPQAVASHDCPFVSEYTHLYAALGLNQEQLKRIEPLAADFHEKTRTIGEQIIEQRNSLVAEMAKDNVDQGTLDAIHRDIAVMQSKMQQLVVSHILQMKDIMTPEQREKFFSAMQRSFKAQNFMTY